jgi:hypothetical protein
LKTLGTRENLRNTSHFEGSSTESEAKSVDNVYTEERLKCYRMYFPDLPEDATPQLTREYSEQVKRTPKPAPRAKPRAPDAGCNYRPPVGRGFLVMSVCA